MVIIRFNRHGETKEYKSFSCRNYNVSFDSEGEAQVQMDGGTEHEQYEYVGDKSPYGIAYVTNVDSRTIDVIKALPREIMPDAG